MEYFSFCRSHTLNGNNNCVSCFTVAALFAFRLLFHFYLFFISHLQKCFDREDLLDDYQQVIAEATSGKSADHHDHHDRHHQEHEAPVTAENLLYIEHLTNIIVNRLASG